MVGAISADVFRVQILGSTCPECAGLHTVAQQATVVGGLGHSFGLLVCIGHRSEALVVGRMRIVIAHNRAPCAQIGAT